MIDIFKEKLKNKGEVYLRIKVKPNSSKTDVLCVMEDDTVKMSIKAVPEKGKANTELIKYLSKQFRVEKKYIKIISGAGDRTKLLKITI